MASAYYNENDPKMAAWLRELIKAGVIVPGEVDERSIWDVVPSDVMGFTQCHFFAGQGSWSYALRQAGWSDDRRVWTGSCPCQDFSGAGKRAGLAGERHLWPAWFHFPLASRTSERMVRGSRSRLPFNADDTTEARVMRLHGYGNGICVPVAEEFIKAYMESEMSEK